MADSNDITPNITIGNHKCTYDSFDIIINANYPHHGQSRQHEITISYPTSVYPNTIYYIGLLDDPREPFIELCQELMDLLRKQHQTRPNARYLFQCHRGSCRSVCFAIAFMVDVLGMDFIEVTELIDEHRAGIEPRDEFLNALITKYLKSPIAL